MISEFPLMLFTVLTGIACGSYVGAALFPRKDADGRPWLLPLVVLVLAALGGLAATGHLGRIQNIMNVLDNPGSSITMEGICTGVLAAVAVVDLLLARRKSEAVRAVRIVGAVVGLAFLCIVTSVYVKSYGNPVWMAAPTYCIFVAGGLAAGLACWRLLAGGDAAGLDAAIAALSAVFAAVLAWQAAVFAGFDAAGMAPIAAGAVISLAAAVAAGLAIAGKLDAKAAGIAVAVLAVAALLASRYGFYMASII